MGAGRGGSGPDDETANYSGLQLRFVRGNAGSCKMEHQTYNTGDSNDPVVVYPLNFVLKDKTNNKKLEACGNYLAFVFYQHPSTVQAYYKTSAEATSSVSLSVLHSETSGVAPYTSICLEA